MRTYNKPNVLPDSIYNKATGNKDDHNKIQARATTTHQKHQRCHQKLRRYNDQHKKHKTIYDTNTYTCNVQHER